MPKLARPSTGVMLALLGVFAWAATLAVPHPVAPGAVPAPSVDFEQLHAVEKREAELAARARATPLSYAARSVGELIRRYGQSEFKRDAQEAELLRRDLQKAVRQITNREELRWLRALQTELFLSELDSKQAPSPALIELSGSFAARSQRPGFWTEPAWLPEQSELGAVYRIRWNDLTGLSHHPEFQVSANERRLDFRMRLRSYERLPVPERGRAELAAITALQRYDPNYPSAFARGIALIHAGAYQTAFDTFHAYLSETPDSRYSLRARNFALYAAQEFAN